MKHGLIDQTYGSADQLQIQLATFAKKFAGFGAMRKAVMINKQQQFEETIAICRSAGRDPAYWQYIAQLHPGISAKLKKQWAA